MFYATLADTPIGWRSPTNELLVFDNAQVSFQWRDYKDKNRNKVIKLEASEFIRRFLLHVLP